MYMSNIAIFASGSGTNAQNLIEYFSNRKGAKVTLVLSNCSEAYVLERVRKLSVKAEIFDRDDFYNSGRVMRLLNSYSIDFIVLAGFLWLVPPDLIDIYRGKIINIHPALLPAYGGKGMYGARVHEAVIANRERESGITIHLVNEEYDAGDIIFQAKCKIEPGENPGTLAKKIHKLEQKHFPGVVEEVIASIRE